MLGASFSQNERNHTALAPHGSTLSEIWAAEPSQYEEATLVLNDGLRAMGATHIAVIGRSEALSALETAEDLLLPMVSYPTSVLCNDATDAKRCGLEYFGAETSIAVVEAADIAAVLGVELPAATMRAYANGAALVLNRALVDDAEIEIGFWRTSELWQADGSTGPTPFTQDREHTVRWEHAPAIAIDAPVTHMPVLLSPKTAADLGIHVIPRTVVGSFVDPPRDAELDAINQVGISSTSYSFWVNVERGPDQPWPWYLLVAGIASILVLGASAVSIGLARFDGRADDAALAAVGGGRNIRRRISFWQAVVITGVGALVGTATGLLPSWGFAEANDGLRVADFPWLLIAGVAVGLPLLVAATAWLVSPRPAVLTGHTTLF